MCGKTMTKWKKIVYVVLYFRTSSDKKHVSVDATIYVHKRKVSGFIDHIWQNLMTVKECEYSSKYLMMTYHRILDNEKSQRIS